MARDQVVRELLKLLYKAVDPAVACFHGLHTFPTRSLVFKFCVNGLPTTILTHNS
jgi:hypothetical protein